MYVCWLISDFPNKPVYTCDMRYTYIAVSVGYRIESVIELTINRIECVVLSIPWHPRVYYV